jgi:hypothetical protein
VHELAPVLRSVIGARGSGPVFLRAKFDVTRPSALRGDRVALARAAQERVERARREQAQPLTRKHEQKIRETVWRDAGAVPVDRIRTSFIRACRAAGLSATCPKSWRHPFATLLQEANVDLIQVRPRALLTLDLGTLVREHGGEVSADCTPQEIVVDLFDPPEHIKHLPRILAARKAKLDKGQKASLSMLAAETGVGRMSIKRALRYTKLMEAEGLSEPYRVLIEKPAKASRWKPRKQKEDSEGSPPLKKAG